MKKISIFLYCLSLLFLFNTQASELLDKTTIINNETVKLPTDSSDIQYLFQTQGLGDNRLDAISDAVINATLLYQGQYQSTQPPKSINYSNDIINRLRHNYGLEIEYKIQSEYMTNDKYTVDLHVYVSNIEEAKIKPKLIKSLPAIKPITLFVDKRLNVDIGEILMLVQDSHYITYGSVSFSPTGTTLNVFSNDQGLSDLAGYINNVTETAHSYALDDINYFLYHNEVSALAPSLYEVLISYKYTFSTDLFYKFFNFDPTVIISFSNNSKGRTAIISTHDSKDLFVSTLFDALQYSIKDDKIAKDDLIIDDNYLKVGYDDSLYQYISEWAVYLYEYLQSLYKIIKGYIHL